MSHDNWRLICPRGHYSHAAGSVRVESGFVVVRCAVCGCDTALAATSERAIEKLDVNNAYPECKKVYE